MTTQLAALSCFALIFMLVAAPAAAQPLTEQERGLVLKHLQQTRQAFLDSISGLSDAQWTFKAAPDRWSIAEVAEHIALSETTIFQLITTKLLASPPFQRDPNGMTDEQLMAGVLDRTNRFQAPEILRPTNRWATRDALAKDFIAARDKTEAYVKATTDDLRGHGAPHPVVKMLDGYQWLLFLSAHSGRHTAQINEVKESPGYPK
jgi:hypothetical protein